MKKILTYFRRGCRWIRRPRTHESEQHCRKCHWQQRTTDITERERERKREITWELQCVPSVQAYSTWALPPCPPPSPLPFSPHIDLHTFLLTYTPPNPPPPPHTHTPYSPHLADRHHVGGESACLVGADHRGAAQCLHRGEAAHNGILTSHAAGTFMCVCVWRKGKWLISTLAGQQTLECRC